ncbi:MAG TPA: histidine phosphatase family protein [Acidimicrobiales bacterium]|nr:histidine phosphatase family protein [Acidimicrobiales bacterium]
MPTDVFLVRHGEKADAGPGDPGISARGRTKARGVAELLAPVEPVALYSSPLKRARETAEVVGRQLGLPVVDDGRLRERANWGDVLGQSFEEFVKSWQRCAQDRDYIPPGGISARQAGERLAAFVVDQARRYPDAAVVGVTHGGVIVDFLLTVLAAADLAEHNPDYLAMDFCAVTHVRADGGRLELVRLAATSL